MNLPTVAEVLVLIASWRRALDAIEARLQARDPAERLAPDDPVMLIQAFAAAIDAGPSPSPPGGN